MSEGSRISHPQPEQMEASRPGTPSSSSSSPAGDGYLGRKAEEYAQHYAEETPGGYALRVRRKIVLEMFDKPGGRVLDLGCGPGKMVQDLLDLGCEFWGVDPSAKMIEICTRGFRAESRAHFVIGEAGRLSFPDDFFDAVLCMGVIDSLKNLRPALAAMLRVLKPGGTLIATFANRTSPYVWWKAFVFYPAIGLFRRMIHRETNNDPIFNRRLLFTPQEACERVSSAGARVERIVGHNYNVLLSPLDEIWPAGTLWLNRKLEEGRGGKTDWLAAGLILKARKNKGQDE